MTYNSLTLAFLVIVTFYSTTNAQNRDSLESQAENFIQNNDFEHAIPVLSQAADLGSAKAQYNYALCLLQGEGVEENDSLANVFLEKTGNQNNVDAQYKLAHSYRTGRGTAPNIQKAIYWYGRAAELNDLESQENLAVYYTGGNGVPRDTVKMLYWLTRAATQRNPKDDTIESSAIKNQSGDTIVAEMTAVGYQNSTEISSLRYSLASMYFAGESVPKDSLKGYVWLLITNENKKDFPAAHITNGPCQADLIDQIKFLESQLSVEQQQEAEKGNGTIEFLTENKCWIPAFAGMTLTL
jgi:uncharacterized protein